MQNVTEEKIQYLTQFGLNTLSMKSRFDKYTIERLKRAFENKEEFHATGGLGIQRELRIDAKLCEDGVYRAWYTSEYPDCANGRYYLLINPTTATFSEDD